MVDVIHNQRMSGLYLCASRSVPLLHSLGLVVSTTPLLFPAGRLQNLNCATGHPSFEISPSFLNQMLAQFDLLRNWKETKGWTMWRSELECCPWRVLAVVKRKFGDAHHLLVRKPPSSLLEVLLHRRHWGLSRWCLVRLPSLRDRAASDQGPGHHSFTYDVVAARRPPMK